MISNGWRKTVTFIFATVGVCSVAHADSLSPFAYFWPGIIHITFVYAFPASVLAAFVERPFLSSAGITRGALLFSLRANFISTFAGILLIPIGYPALYTIGPIWCIVSFCVSCAVEFWYINRFTRDAINWRWVVGGNAISSFILMILPPVAYFIEESNRHCAWTLEPYKMFLATFSVVASLATFLGGFLIRVRYNDLQDVKDISDPENIGIAPNIQPEHAE